MTKIDELTEKYRQKLVKKNRGNKFLYFFLLIGIFVPFQVKMMPLVQVMSNFHMLNVKGITVVYIASAVCEGVFLYVAFIQGVPGELEESAYIDGAETDDSYSAYHGRSVVLERFLPAIAGTE